MKTIGNFLLNLLEQIRKHKYKNYKEADKYEVYEDGIVLILAALIFCFNLYSRMTRYFPFSLLFRNKLFHYRNRNLGLFIHIVEEASVSFGHRFLMYCTEENNNFYYAYGYLRKGKINLTSSAKIARKIETDNHLPAYSVNTLTGSKSMIVFSINKNIFYHSLLNPQKINQNLNFN